MSHLVNTLSPALFFSPEHGRIPLGRARNHHGVRAGFSPKIQNPLPVVVRGVPVVGAAAVGDDGDGGEGVGLDVVDDGLDVVHVVGVVGSLVLGAAVDGEGRDSRLLDDLGGNKRVIWRRD